MIRRELQSQVYNLEKKIAAAVQAKRDKAEGALIRAYSHAIQVAAVVLYGEPNIEEPLRIAWSRVKEKLTKEFGAAADEWWLQGGEEELPHHLRVSLLYAPFMFDKFPGGSYNLKFERIFSEAPAWLLKFTAVEWDAKLLGFKLRELVGTPELGRRARHDRNSWPSLPQETIDAGGPCSEPEEPLEKIIERRCY